MDSSDEEDLLILLLLRRRKKRKRQSVSCTCREHFFRRESRGELHARKVLLNFRNYCAYSLLKYKMADKTPTTLPLSRVKTIMKSSPDVSSISQEALYTTGRATELFIQALARFSHEQSPDSGSLEYRDLAEIVNTEATLQFLQDIIPRKIKVRDYYKLCEKQQEEK